MKKILSTIASIFITSLCFAGTVKWNDQQIDYDNQFSLKDFTATNPTQTIPSGTTVYASCFSREVPDTIVFDGKMDNVTFINCNLDNVLISVGNIVKTWGRDPPRRFRAENDLRDWEVTPLDIPTKVLNEDYWKAQGYSVDPLDIPATRLSSIDEIRKVAPPIVISP